jgi:hypothetical protein
MALSDSYTEIKGGRECKTCRFYEGLDPGDRLFFDKKAMEREDRDAAALHRACIQEGFTGSLSSMKRHLEHHVPQ